MVWGGLSVVLQHYAMTHCSTCNVSSSRCVHALGLVQSIGGFDFDLLLWSGMLWRWWGCIGQMQWFFHGSMQPKSLACAVDMNAVVDWLDHRFYDFGCSRWFLLWDDCITPRPTTMSTVIILCAIGMTHDNWTHILFRIELWVSSFSSWSMPRLHHREQRSYVFFCSNSG